MQPLSALPAFARPTEAALPAALPSPEARSVRRPRRPVASVGGRPPRLPTNGLRGRRGPPAPRPCPSATAAGLLFSRQPLGQFVPGDGDPAPPSRPLFSASKAPLLSSALSCGLLPRRDLKLPSFQLGTHSCLPNCTAAAFQTHPTSHLTSCAAKEKDKWSAIKLRCAPYPAA